MGLTQVYIFVGSVFITVLKLQNAKIAKKQMAVSFCLFLFCRLSLRGICPDVFASFKEMLSLCEAVYRIGVQDMSDTRVLACPTPNHVHPVLVCLTSGLGMSDTRVSDGVLLLRRICIVA